MCCDEGDGSALPPLVAAMLAEYRTLNAGRRYDWGGKTENVARGQAYARWLGPWILAAVFAGQDGDWPAAVRGFLPDPVPAGLIVASLAGDGVRLRAGPTPYAIPGATAEVGVLLDSRLDDPTQLEVDATLTPVEAGGVELVTITGPADRTISIGPATARLGESAAPARLRLRARSSSRWSVVDDRGGAWFPDGRLHKWDYHGRPMFHGNDLVLEVPAVPLTVTCTRGMEFGTEETTLTPEPEATTGVELEPARLYETAARGWYGGDLHVHMNYSGDLVCEPDDAACMQLGEGLHLMNLVAGNLGDARVYDREAFESTVGHDLPWTAEERVARFGVEFRNDLLGHFHVLGPSGRPTRYFTGHAASDHPVDWPPNAVACREFQGLGAPVGYTHPVFSPLGDGSAAEAFSYPRSVEARELVADAALGLVDSVDLLGPNDAEGTALLYHHLLNCGLRLAATAGTDVWLSYSRGPLISNPPGWARVYADLRGAPLSVAAFQDAIRAGRTLATNGPWLELTVDGRRPGDTLHADPGQPLPVSVRATGLGITHLDLIGPDGVLARTRSDSGGSGSGGSGDGGLGGEWDGGVSDTGLDESRSGGGGSAGGRSRRGGWDGGLGSRALGQDVRGGGSQGDVGGSAPAGGGRSELEHLAIDAKVEAGGSMWLCAVARGPRHPSVLGPVVFAHTSPVYVEVQGRPVVRATSARWLLDWLDRLEELVRTHGQFADDGQRDEVIAVIDQARPFYQAQAAG
jgi:hypothetical protein